MNTFYPDQVKILGGWDRMHKGSPINPSWVINIWGPFCIIKAHVVKSYVRNTHIHSASIRVSNMVSHTMRQPTTTHIDFNDESISIQVVLSDDEVNELIRQVRMRDEKRKNIRIG